MIMSNAASIQWPMRLVATVGSTMEEEEEEEEEEEYDDTMIVVGTLFDGLTLSRVTELLVVQDRSVLGCLSRNGSTIGFTFHPHVCCVRPNHFRERDVRSSTVRQELFVSYRILGRLLKPMRAHIVVLNTMPC